MYNLVLENFAKMFVFKCSAINETEIKLAHVATHVKVCIGQKFHLNLIVSLRDTSSRERPSGALDALLLRKEGSKRFRHQNLIF